jgi:hypothetical protein
VRILRKKFNEESAMSDLDQSNTPETDSSTTTATPISEARSAASRENGQKSHGPVSPEGKAKSALNAVRCNLTSNHVILTAEDAPRYHTHITDYQTQFQPIGPEESALVQSIADLRWRLNRIPGIEQSILFTEGANFIAENPIYAAPAAHLALEREVRLRHEKEFRNLALQEHRLSRRREREAAELERLQIARRAKEDGALAEAAKASLLAQHRKEPLAKIPGLGFVFSKLRFATYMSRLTPTQKAKLLNEAIAEYAELPQTMEAAA